MTKSRGILTPILKMSLAERLEHFSIPEPNSGCILWFGAADKHGYGKFSYRGAQKLAHRASWELRYGPTSFDCLHKCDVPACINTDHLFLGTQSDNSRDMVRKGRHPKGSTAGPAVLTDEQVLAIRDDRRTHRAIATAYGVTHGTVGRIKRRTGWRHLPEEGRQAIAELQKREGA